MSKPYQITTKKDTRKLAEFLSRESEVLLPMLDLITEARMAVDELVDTAGRARRSPRMWSTSTTAAGRASGRCAG